MKNIFLILFFFSLTLWASDPNSPYDKLPNGFETPHITWAKPYIGGKIKALLIAPTWGQRETIELAQRFDIETCAAMTCSYDDFDGSQKNYYMSVPAKEVKDAFRRKLSAKYDVIIIGSVKWEILPSFVRLKIIKAVYKGAGLLYIRPTLNAELKKMLRGKELSSVELLKTIPIDGLKAFSNLSSDSILKIKSFGKGKIAVLNYKEGRKSPFQPLTPAEGDYSKSRFFYDYYFSLIGKILFAITNRKSKAEITKISISDNNVNVFLKKSDSIKNLTAKIIVRDYEKKEFSNQIPLSKSETQIKFNIPSLKGGTHFVDVILSKDGKTVDWASQRINITRKEKIESIKLSKKCFEAGKIINGELQLIEGKANRVKLEIHDNYNRLIAVKTITLGSKKAYPFAIKIKANASLSKLLKLTVFMYKDQRPLAEKNISILTSKKHDMKDFFFVAWLGSPAKYSAREFMLNTAFFRALRSYGVDVGFEPFTRRYSNAELSAKAYSMTANNMDILPLIYGLHFYMRAKKNISKSCFATAEWRDKMNSAISRQAEVLKAYSPLAYSLGDENGLSLNGEEISFDKKTINEFRKWLKSKYKNLNALNAEWNTTFKTWNTVIPFKSEQARKNKNYPPFVDFRIFMDSAFTLCHKNASETINRITPTAQAGSDGFLDDTSLAGYNFYELLKVSKFFVAYNKAGEIEQGRSFVKDGSLTGIWYGTYQTYEMTDSKMRYYPFLPLFYGFNSTWWWMAFPDEKGAGGASALTPSLTPLKGFKVTTEAIRKIKNGIGKMILTAQKPKCRIAILYSEASQHVAFLDKGKLYYKKCLDRYIKYFRDTGLEFNFIAPEEILNGELSQYKVLVLVQAKAVSNLLANKILTYVKNGGKVVADFTPGIRDEHGKMRKKSVLEKLFPKFITSNINTLGSGKSFYLGNYKNLSKQLNSFLGKSNIRPKVEIRLNGKRVAGIKRTLYRNGKIKYLFILPGLMLKRNIYTITIPGKCHIYDVLKKRKIAYASKINYHLGPGEAVILSLAESKLDKAEVKLENEHITVGGSLGFQISFPGDNGAISRTVRLDLFDPTGKKLSHYGKNISVKNNIYSGEIFFAFNERKGQWKIRFTDVTTGKVNEKSFDLK